VLRPSHALGELGRARRCPVGALLSVGDAALGHWRWLPWRPLGCVCSGL
jgi:hypothetical protein